jgi:hypothetical protein
MRLPPARGGQPGSCLAAGHESGRAVPPLLDRNDDAGETRLGDDDSFLQHFAGDAASTATITVVRVTLEGDRFQSEHHGPNE